MSRTFQCVGMVVSATSIMPHFLGLSLHFYAIIKGIYAQSESEAIFRARTYNWITYNCSPVMITWWMKLGGNRPPGDNPLFFLISGMGSFICLVAETWLDIPKPLITQSRSTGGKAEMLQLREWDSNRQHIGSQSNVLPTKPSWLPLPHFWLQLIIEFLVWRHHSIH